MNRYSSNEHCSLVTAVDYYSRVVLVVQCRTSTVDSRRYRAPRSCFRARRARALSWGRAPAPGAVTARDSRTRIRSLQIATGREGL